MAKYLQKLIDIKSLITALTVLVGALLASYTQLGAIVEEVTGQIYEEVTAPAYDILKFDLLKQLEKLQSDPSDIKRQDILKFTQFCEGYFGRVYVPAQGPLEARNLALACDKIISMY